MSESGAWQDVLALDDVDVGAMAVVRRGPKQIVITRLSADELHAIDNRCPHEGYPLRQGSVKEGVLTCEWHNWKFRLADGACLLGGEDVRRYPLRVEGGRILLDLGDPPPETVAPGVEASLAKAFDEMDGTRAAREVNRLLALGRTPEQVLGFAADWVASRAKYGFEHGLATAADLATFLEGDDPESAAVLYAAIWTAVEPHVRRPARDFPAPAPVDVDAQGRPDWAATGERLNALIEAQEVRDAEALMRGAIGSGVEPATAFDWVTRATTDHFLDFAHQHIYSVKCEELLGAIGWEHAHPVLTSHVSAIAYGTREDLLPYMRAWRTAIPAHVARLAAWAALAPDEHAAFDELAFRNLVLDGELTPALDMLAAALSDRVAPTRIALTLGVAAAHRILRFDPAIDGRADVKQGWLWVTHTLTHADAVHETLRRRPSAHALRGLFHSVRFIQHLKVLDGDERPPATQSAFGADTFLAALHDHDVPAAMAQCEDALATDDAALEGALRASCAESRLVRAIFFQHHVKTVLAALRLARAGRALGLSGFSDPVRAATYFIAHPLREQNLRYAADSARAFVREGKLPGSLLPY